MPGNDLAAFFEQHKYVVLRSVLQDTALSFAYDYALKRAASGTMLRGDRLMPATPAAYGDPFMELLLEKFIPRVEAATARRLYPSYSYLRVYQRGDRLARHRDGEACEISLSLALGYKAARPWPLFLEAPSGVAQIELACGDALLYRGIECFHWREAFDGEHAAQVFLHYVDRDGPNAGWRFDKRKGLTPFPEHLKSLFRV